MILALLLILIAPDDPRPELIELQLEHRHQAALNEVDRLLASSPETAREWGLEYLKGHLLEILGRQQEAPAAFSAAMTSQPPLAHYGRYRLALGQHRAGHPEVAARLLATLLAMDPPRSLVDAAVRLLASSLSLGADCHLLDGMADWNLPRKQRRQLQVSLADCAAADGDQEVADELLVSILIRDREDETAREAAEILDRRTGATRSSETALLIGLAFFQHREFERAVAYLERALQGTEDPTRQLADVDRNDVLYARARCDFWQQDYAAAATTFAEVALAETSGEDKARALFQQGRSYELTGDWTLAAGSYRDAFEADRASSWAPAALLSRLRIEWRQGREEVAVELLELLRSRRDWRSLAERAALFLAVSELVRGRSDRVEGWLEAATRPGRSQSPEVLYWRGRLAELEGQVQKAVRSYAALLVISPYHPLAAASRSRLGLPTLADTARSEGQRFGSSSRSQDLLAAWLTLGDSDPVGLAARSALRSRMARSSRTRTYLELAPVPADRWTLWQRPPRSPEETLLTLGIVEQISPVVRQVFPLQKAELALTGSRLLAASGHHQRSLYLAEVVSDRLPTELPHRFLPEFFRRLLYPRPYDELVVREADRFDIDPHLMTAIIREESRFDPLAISSASALGLTQFVLPTARRLADTLGWQRLRPADLHRPEISIALGAAYLAELARRFDDRTHLMIAAYNAGEDQARLWLSHCHSREPEEYFTKVSFRQTRDYLEKVWSSRELYREIYGGE